MVVTKPASVWKANWDAARARVPAAYTAGVQANTSWHAAAIAGQDLYNQQMSSSTVRMRRLDGLNTKTNQADWQNSSKVKGGARISEGMAAGKPAYDASADKNVGILTAVTLIPRTGDFRTNITNRVVPIVEALKAGWGKI